MKTFIRKGLIVGVCIAVLSPAPAAFSCIPTSSTSSHVDPVKRKRWVVKRMRHLKHEQEIDHAMIVLDGNHQASREVRRQRGMTRLEYLLLKSEMGELTQSELNELMMWQNSRRR